MSTLFKSVVQDYDLLSFLNNSIIIGEHGHPLLFVFTPDRAKEGNNWTCNICYSNYEYNIPSFYCTLCDFDLCQNCLAKHKLNEISLYDNSDLNNKYSQQGSTNQFKWQKKNPNHNHSLTMIKKRNKKNSWKCNKCSQIFQNENSAYYCSLCDWYICQQCFNGSNQNNFPNFKNIQNIPLNWPNINSPNFLNQNNDFQVKSFVILNKYYQNDNLLYCPLPLQILFTILSNGIIEGNALNEIKNVFSIHNLEFENQYYINLLNSISNDNILNIANSIFTAFEPSKQFKASLAKFRAVISNSMNELNNFIYQNTNGKVRDYYNASDFYNTLMILTNVLYFKADWKHEFEKCPQKKIFNNSKGQIELDFIKKKQDYRYYKDNSIEAIELQYKKGDITALIVLPDKALNINYIIDSLTKEKIYQIYNRLTYQKVELYMPKFKFDDQRKRIDLTQLLKNMGISEIFNTSTTTFSILTGNNTPFQIDKIFQTNLLDVNEKGTELISITSVATFGCIKMELPKIMTVDRPFLFILRNNSFQKGKDFILLSKIDDIKQYRDQFQLFSF